LRRSAAGAGTALIGLAIIALAVELILLLSGSASGTGDGRNCVVVTAMFAAGAATVLTGLGRPSGTRAPWVLLGCASLSYASGSFVLFFLEGPLTTFPGRPDILWLAFYPFAVGAIVLLARHRRAPNRPGISLDAAIIALATGALGYGLIFTGLIDAGTATRVVGGQLSYSVLDFTILVMLVLVCAPSRDRLGRAFVVLGAGMFVFLASDIFVVKQIAAGTYSPGSLLDVGWPAGILLFALAARSDASLRPVRAMRGRSLYGTIALPFCVAFALLVEEGLGERNPVVLLLAALVPCLILIRLLTSVRDNERLVRDVEQIVSVAGEGIFRVDAGGIVTYANPAAERMLGYAPDELVGRYAHGLFHHTRANGTPYPAADCPSARTRSEGESQRVTDEVYWRKDGLSFPVDYTTAPIRESGGIVGSVTVFDDVTHQRNFELQLRHLADRDSLTGLYNRRRFDREVANQLRYAERYLRPGALMLLDLDTFKFINDSYGHPRGDRLLCEVGATLSATVRETDVVARIGGDEFAVLLREALPADAVRVAKDLIAAIRAVSDPTVGASIGIAAFDGAEERTPDELLVAADISLYDAKEAGGGTAVVDSGHKGQALTWVERIRSALAEERLVVYGQPIVDLKSGQVARLELLVRMLDEHGDVIPPISFLPTAERFGLIAEIDLLVLRKAIDLVAGGASVATNVSTRTLTDPRYLHTLEEAIAGGLPPAHFDFEITETAAVANMSEAQDFARRVHDLGCTLSLDDFGTGFSSFTYLKHIPAQHLKIDIEFISELQRSPADRQLVVAIVAIAKALGQKTVAEGVEDSPTLEIVRSLGIDFAQGFFLGAPQSAEGNFDLRTRLAKGERLVGMTEEKVGRLPDRTAQLFPS
jgi:diguanylate cyclase (GGDEF)-like protein/PAS domain S-box-containing protein